MLSFKKEEITNAVKPNRSDAVVEIANSELRVLNALVFFVNCFLQSDSCLSVNLKYPVSGSLTFLYRLNSLASKGIGFSKDNV